MSQMQSILGGSGSVSLSQFGGFTRGGSTSATNINVGAFAGANPTFVSGLQFRTFPGAYFADVPSFFDTKTETNTGLITDFTNLTTATNSIYTANGSASAAVFSVEWYGYFYAPTSGSYTFTIASDDGSYVWIGANALSGYTTTNSFINNGGVHSFASVSASTTLTGATYNPIRIQFGDAGGGYNCQLSFSGPGIATTNNFSKYFFFPIGGNTSFPCNAARLIKAATSTNTDGTYYINVNGTSALTYCLMNSAWSGGGWMMLLKATRGSTFNFSSGYWNTVNTLNAGSTDLTDSDAKFNVMNYALLKDVLALWPDVTYSGGSIASPPISTWTWMVNNYYSNGTTRITALAGLGGNSRTVADDGSSVGPTASTATFKFSGFNANIWTTQNGMAGHVMGGGSHLPSTSGASTAWGFIFNENPNWSSIDVFGGIGMSYSWGGYNSSSSAGDFLGCCQNTTGLNRTMRVQLFGR